MTVLEQIVERTRERLRSEQKPDRKAAEDVAQSREPHALRRALRRESAAIIAEIKAASPSAGPIVLQPQVESIAHEYRDGGAAAISIVTEPEFFKGDTAWLERARTAELPLLMKDFIVAPQQIVNAVACGADGLLLLASVLDAIRLRDFISLLEAYGCDAVVEVHDERELENALEAGATIIGVNNRDLRDFAVDLATSERLVRSIPESIVRVAESGIRSAADVARLRSAGFDAMLVGEALLRRSDRAAALRELAGL